MKPLDIEKIMQEHAQGEADFIKTRMEKFGETESQAKEMYEHCIRIIALHALKRLPILMKKALAAANS